MINNTMNRYYSELKSPVGRFLSLNGQFNRNCTVPTKIHLKFWKKWVKTRYKCLYMCFRINPLVQGPDPFETMREKAKNHLEM